MIFERVIVHENFQPIDQGSAIADIRRSVGRV